MLRLYFLLKGHMLQLPTGEGQLVLRNENGYLLGQENENELKSASGCTVRRPDPTNAYAMQGVKELVRVVIETQILLYKYKWTLTWVPKYEQYPDKNFFLVPSLIRTWKYRHGSNWKLDSTKLKRSLSKKLGKVQPYI